MWLSDRTVEHLRAVADEPDLSGTRYRLIELIGRGGMGTVYRARDAGLDRDVAIKILRAPETDDGNAAVRLLAESRILASLEHPGIVPVHDAGTLPDGRVFCAMKLVRGQRLDELAAGPAGLAERLRIFQRICETVAFAHAHGVLHRDLKPPNIMVGAFGEVLVLDWGIAKQTTAGAADREIEDDGRRSTSSVGAGDDRARQPGDEDPARLARMRPDGSGADRLADERAETTVGTRVGTPGWMAPEQERGRTDHIDERTDVFGLGAILRHLLESAPREPAPPARIRAIAERATSPEREDRYPSVNEMSADVGRFLAGLAVTAYREPAIERAVRLIGKYRTPILLVLTYLLMRVVLIVIAD